AAAQGHGHRCVRGSRLLHSFSSVAAAPSQHSHDDPSGQTTYTEPADLARTHTYLRFGWRCQFSDESATRLTPVAFPVSSCAKTSPASECALSNLQRPANTGWQAVCNARWSAQKQRSVSNGWSDGRSIVG